MRFLLRSIYSFYVFAFVAACSSQPKETKEEHIRLTDKKEVVADSALSNAIQGNLTFQQIQSRPHQVELTGLAAHRLVTIYKSAKPTNLARSYDYSYGKRYDYDESDRAQHYMPGLDIVYGYNLINIAHYDLTTEKLNYLFNNPVLIKSLYYPSFVQDSLNKKPITRDYYLVSVYEEDTNRDTLITKNDLRRFYHFNASASQKVQLVPNNYSVVRSQYDSMNDVIYIFARQDSNQNGKIDKEEPLHIFWMSLKQPAEAKRLY
jgi:hypothetical protein